MPQATEQDLDKINKLTLVPLTTDNCYVFKDRMIDDLITSYYSRVHKNLLRKFVKDASRGVGLLMSHDNRKLPVGRSYEAIVMEEYVEGEEDLVTTMYGSFYIDLGRNTETGMTTDDIAKGIDAGTIFDTSIGFSANRWECSICKNDIRDYRQCSHYPGEQYIVEGPADDEGNTVNQVQTCIAIAGTDGKGELVENSLVYAGACNRATIVSEFSERGNTDLGNDTKLHLIDSIKNVPLDAKLYQYYANDGCVMYSSKPMNSGGSEKLGKGSEQELKFEEFKAECAKYGIEFKTSEELGSKLSEMSNATEELTKATTKLTEMDNELAQKTEEISELTTKNTELGEELKKSEALVEELNLKNEELTEKAELAETYRKELNTQALELGVRAQGNAFNKTLYGKFLETLSINEVKEVIKGFEAEVAGKFSGAKFTKTGEPLKDRLSKGPTAKEDFESDAEFRAYVADEAIKYSKENDVSIKEATQVIYSKFKYDGSGE